ncbi:TetR family transcriptional regulator [Actinoallomurus bryophytorum]|uniref:TetR family transcriptional regulator n=1 Tax=Actinoallomurus bryophytorum TaxID=1490222 RepID=A0A543CTW2_9ACTN|nr:TetR family transcriptional regulator [Actinoallomurus bryophytorum]
MGHSEDARGRLVRTAARLFLARSYQAVGVDELCAAADVRKGSFYYFFRSKSELAKAVIDRHALALWARLDEAGATEGEGSPVERLHAIADAVGEIQQGFERRFGKVVGCPFGNLAAELATTDDALHEHLATMFAEWEGRLAAICRDAAAQHALRAGADPDLLARILIAQFQGMILLAKTGRSSAAEIPAALHQVIDSHLMEGAGA